MDSDPLAKGSGADAGEESSAPIELPESQDSGFDQSEQHSQELSPPEAVTDLLPAKRVRKPIDKEFIPLATYLKRPVKIAGTEQHIQQKKPRLHAKSAPRQVAGKDRGRYAPQPEAEPEPEPLPLRHSFIAPSIVLSTYDKAAQLQLSPDQLICHGCEGGYRMVRATQGVASGSYYFEVEVLPPGAQGRRDLTSAGAGAGASVGLSSSSAVAGTATGTGAGNGTGPGTGTGAGAGMAGVGRRMPEAHVRVGWSGRLGELQAPVGFDQHSFAYGDVQGTGVAVAVGVLCGCCVAVPSPYLTILSLLSYLSRRYALCTTHYALNTTHYTLHTTH
jgi:hypothetical protein